MAKTAAQVDAEFEEFMLASGIPPHRVAEHMEEVRRSRAGKRTAEDVATDYRGDHRGNRGNRR